MSHIMHIASIRAFVFALYLVHVIYFLTSLVSHLSTSVTSLLADYLWGT